MQVPNPERAVIDHAKLRDYLLSRAHRDGQHKARLFESLGYVRTRWQELEDDLRAQFLSSPATPGRSTPYGRKFEIEGTLVGRNGRSMSLVTVWIVRDGADHASFVTAFPRATR